MIDRDRFFPRVRTAPFEGRISRSQLAGMEAILREWGARKPGGDLRWLAYMLATTFHETDRTMQPIEEYGRGRGRAYGVPDPITGQAYFGRGYVQLTWKANYQKMSGLVGVDLVHEPARALEPAIAAAILFEGMEGGLFTGVGLPRYFGAATDDPRNARRIINGMDRADEIAAIHRAFLEALS